MRIRGARLSLLFLGAMAWLATSSIVVAGEGQGPPHPAATAPKPAPKPAAPKPGARPPAPAQKAPAPKKGGGRRAPRKAGSEAGEPDEATRRIIAGTASRSVRESAELKAIRELDAALFPALGPSAGAPWIAEGTPVIDRGEPRLLASGMPPETTLTPLPVAEPTPDLSWLRQLTMPDIPVRWDARVIRYLEYYKNNPRGRSMVQSWIKKSGRYGGAIRRILREQGLPEDILWLSLVESGFDPTVQSPAGAAGLWQFMPEGARIYGLTVDRWVDERLDPERATLAAARYLADLRQRFGGWELGFAAYNMGYGGLLSSIRKYNTNDFWELSRLESGMPFETALYVPKIVAMAIVSRNKKLFGCDDIELDPSINFDKVAIRTGVSLRSLAIAAGASEEKLQELNPQLLAGRAPPLAPGAGEDTAWTVKVPPGTAPRAAKSLSKLIESEAKLTRYLVKWGESLDEIAGRLKVTRSSLQSLNGLRRDEVLRPGTVLFLPAGSAEKASIADQSATKPVVVVPAQAFSYPDRRRVFYRVMPGDTLRDLGPVLGVSPDELCRWNLLDPGAALHESMSLQVFVPKAHSLADVRVLDEADARVLAVGTLEFFAHFEALRGRKRVEMVAKDGDTWRSVATRNKLSMGQIERINQKARTSPLSPGDRYVVYVSTKSTEPGKPVKESDPYEDGAVAVTNPVGDTAVAAAKKSADREKDEGGVVPATLEKAGEPEALRDKVPEAGRVDGPQAP